MTHCVHHSTRNIESNYEYFARMNQDTGHKYKKSKKQRKSKNLGKSKKSKKQKSKK